MALSRLVQTHRVVIKQSPQYQNLVELIASLRCKSIDW